MNNSVNHFTKIDLLICARHFHHRNDSGFFANVTVEEQTPTPDRQRVNVRISAQEKPLARLYFRMVSCPC